MRDYISHAQIALYLQCPLKYAFRYIDGIQPEGTPSQMALGRSIHRALASFYETAKEGSPFRLKDICLGEMEAPTLSQSQLEAIKEVA